MVQSVKALIGRDEAAARGLVRFYTGIPCRRGHDSERYTSTGGCVACQNRFVPKAAKQPLLRFQPYMGLFFGNCPGAQVSQDEAHAAYRYMEACGWHEAAIAALRADPALMAHWSAPPADIEKRMAEAYSARFRASQAGTNGAASSP